MAVLARMYPRWGFVCGRIGVLEARLVGRDFFLTLLAEEHVEDVVPHLEDTFVREHLEPGSAWQDLTAVVDRCFYDLAVSIREDSPSPVPANLFLLQGDYLNIRDALAGAAEFAFPPGLLTLETVAAVANGDVADLPSPLREAARDLSGEAADHGPTAWDIALDGAYLRHLLVLSEQLQAPLVTVCIREKVLAQAVAALWRAWRQKRSMKLYERWFLPLGGYEAVLSELMATANFDAWPAIVGGELGDLLAEAAKRPEDEQVSQFELLATNYLVRLAKDGQLQTAGPDRVFSFLVGLYQEMQNIKLVVCGRLSRIDPVVLRPRVRECYG